MNLNKMKWIGALFPALFVGLFEFVRHYFLDMISMDSGNLMVAGLTGILFSFISGELSPGSKSSVISCSRRKKK